MRTPRATRLLVAALVSFAACKKDEPSPAPEPGSTKSAADVGAPTVEDAEPDAKAAVELPEPLEVPAEAADPKPPDNDGTIAVQLPPSPDLEVPSVADQYDDGAWSVSGLRNHLEERLAEGESGTNILVRAWVHKIYVPPECPAGTPCPPPKQPHIWVADQPDARGLRRAMLVANYAFQIPEWDAKRWEGQPEVVLEKGKQYTFKGKFRRQTDTGFAHDRGVLQFFALRDDTETWIYPPGAPWHPIEVARIEADKR